MSCAGANLGALPLKCTSLRSIHTLSTNVECLLMKRRQFIHFRSKFFHLVDGVFDLSNAFALLWETWLTDQWLCSVHRIISIFRDLSQLSTIHQQRSPRVKYAPSYHVCHICAFKGPVLNLISFAIFQRTRLDLAWEFVKCVRLPSRYEYSPQKPLNASTVKSIPKYQIWILIQILETFLQSIQIHLVV